MGPPAEQAAKFAKLGARMAQMARTQVWVCLSRHHGPNGEPRPSPQIDDILAHLEWALKLEADGKLFAAGPFKNAQGGMQGDGLLVFRAESEAEARTLAASDPIHERGFRDFELLQWELHEGVLDPSLGPLSTQEMNA
jgi:uncharacterized protein YciI